ncbi:MAG TPA: hypothetical protein VEQ87_21060 [Burkholderiales bacterium]|nr:hypothetical protein [Burkholderiales bacterium]
MMTYEERLRAHLAKYKFRVLRVLESGAWRGARTGVLAKRPYILPPGQQRLNILAPFRERFWAELDAAGGERRVQLHRDFAHLTSSQAMGFNLFYPLVADRDWARAFLQGVLGLKDAAPRTLAFEYAEDPEEGTHFDFFIELERGGRVYLEARLCELGFGATDLDERHGEKLAKVYAPRLSALVEPKWLEPDAFFRRYQLLRSLCYLDKPESLLFIVLPRANEPLRKALDVLPEITAGALRSRVRTLYLEEVLEKLSALLRGRDEALKAHYREFAEKYLPA